MLHYRDEIKGMIWRKNGMRSLQVWCPNLGTLHTVGPFNLVAILNPSHVSGRLQRSTLVPEDWMCWCSSGGSDAVPRTKHSK